MSQITENTQINTINVLNETTTVQNSDLFLLQRGNVSFKVQKQHLIIPPSQISAINNMRVLGNVSGSSTSPQQIPITTDLDTTIDNHNELATSKSIKDYLTNKISENVVNKNKKFKINTSQIDVGNVSTTYTTIDQFSFENEFFYAGDVLVIFNMSNRRGSVGGRSYRLLFNDNVIAERRYYDKGGAMDWTFDIMVPLTIPSDDYYNLLIQYNGGGHQIDTGCAISITDF